MIYGNRGADGVGGKSVGIMSRCILAANSCSSSIDISGISGTSTMVASVNGSSSIAMKPSSSSSSSSIRMSGAFHDTTFAAGELSMTRSSANGSSKPGGEMV